MKTETIFKKIAVILLILLVMLAPTAAKAETNECLPKGIIVAPDSPCYIHV